MPALNPINPEPHGVLGFQGSGFGFSTETLYVALWACDRLCRVQGFWGVSVEVVGKLCCTWGASGLQYPLAGSKFGQPQPPYPNYTPYILVVRKYIGDMTFCHCLGNEETVEVKGERSRTDWDTCLQRGTVQIKYTYTLGGPTTL